MSKQHRTICLSAVRRSNKPAAPSGGFKLLELVMVVAVASIISAISLPAISRTMTNMHVLSSATTLAEVIQSTRYQAVSTGCPFEITLTAANNTYQILTEQVITSLTSPPYCASTYTASPLQVDSYGQPVVFANSDVTMSSITPSTTLVLNPSGTVSTAATVTTPALYTIVFSATTGTQTKTLTVSGVGNVGIQ